MLSTVKFNTYMLKISTAQKLLANKYTLTLLTKATFAPAFRSLNLRISKQLFMLATPAIQAPPRKICRTGLLAATISR